MCQGGAAFNLRDPLLQPFQVMVLDDLKFGDADCRSRSASRPSHQAIS
jgi:hypothetical protein